MYILKYKYFCLFFQKLYQCETKLQTTESEEIENEDLIITMTMTKIIITTVMMKIITIIRMIMRIKIGKRLKL